MTQDVAERADHPGTDATAAMFASRSLTEHLVRGLVGLVLVVIALASASEHPWALLAVVPAVVLWRGCPTCWALGLAATLTRGRTGGCDGTC